VLAVIGIYSMMAYAVSQRRHEFGVRMALGASKRDVLRLSLRRAGLLTAAGLGIGVVLAGILSQLLSSALFGVIQFDRAIVVAVTVGLGTVSLAAAYLPALRSVRFDPAAVLRSQ
jgi:ABC-type antimicrobial peptide transport system permease subunit